jgi:hypothetical protein
MTQSASGTNRDKQGKSFVESPSRGANYSAQEVVVTNVTQVNFDFTLNLAFEMLSKNSSKDLSQVNSVIYNKESNVQSIVFLDSNDNEIATMFYTGTNASWSEIDEDTLLLQSGFNILYQDGTKIKL